MQLIRWLGASIAIILVMQPPVAAATAPEPVRIQSDGVELRGELLLPTGAGRHPAIVYLHGSGCATREDMRRFAVHFAARGYAGLLLDKRGCGESQGQWQKASLEDLAADAVSALRFLAGRTDIDAARLGLWGISQSGWVAPIAANRSGLARFVVIVTGGGTAPHDVERFGYMGRLAQAGFQFSELPEAQDLFDDYLRYLASGMDRDKLLLAIEAVSQAPWYAAMNLSRVLPSEADRPAWAWVATYDPVSDIGKLRVPALVLLGAQDRDTPLTESVSYWTKGLGANGIARSQVVIFPLAGHGLTVGGHHGPDAPRVYDEGFLPTVEAWLNTISPAD
ncbi:MAG: CocE/NonD family hydrolase [Steroidobacteraceae bacterium]